MKEWTGQVRTISDRDFQGVKLWSFTLEESERFFRLGKKQPTFTIGDTICFEERNSQVEWSSVRFRDATESDKTVESAPKDENVAATTTSEPSSSVSSVGLRLQYQAARRDATRIVVAALECDHLPHASNVAKGKRLDLLLGYVDEITKSLLKQEEDHGKAE